MAPLCVHLDRPYQLVWCKDVAATFLDLSHFLHWDEAELHPSKRYAELEVAGALLALAAVDIADKTDARVPSAHGPCAAVADLENALRVAKEEGFQPLHHSHSAVLLRGPCGSTLTLVPSGRPCQQW